MTVKQKGRQTIEKAEFFFNVDYKTVTFTFKSQWAVNINTKVMHHCKDMTVKQQGRQTIEKPELLNGSRRRRIALGSGMEVRDVNQLIKQFREMKKMMKTMSKLMGKGRAVDMQSLMGGRMGR